MSMTREQLFTEVMNLDPRERERLVEDLRQRIEGPELTAEQIAELHRRSEAVDRGEMETIPGEQVMEELRERFKR